MYRLSAGSWSFQHFAAALSLKVVENVSLRSRTDGFGEEPGQIGFVLGGAYDIPGKGYEFDSPLSGSFNLDHEVGLKRPLYAYRNHHGLHCATRNQFSGSAVQYSNGR